MNGGAVCALKVMEKLYLYGMTESSKEKQDANLQKKEERIKRMRNWLGVKETSSLGGYADDSGGVVYGDGHSGWNR
jgi:hypothetical protein